MLQVLGRNGHFIYRPDDKPLNTERSRELAEKIAFGDGFWEL